ncbi:hypothetical protein [uncultured Desulfovibrio sp.]|uniref:prenylated flavin chaperone LpdD n=1 Tax=uncultured Desulfovibrio sp. TaxID=167968 RepID=UPI0003A40625|nr:hypothetical protein [uncultured Desulfovibrio sp.]
MRFRLCRGRLELELRVLRLGRDLQVVLNGGEAHLGAVALAAPGGAVEAGLLGLPGHREDQLARRMARRMADALDCAVCVSAGIHYGDISKKEIATVERMAETLTERCLATLATEQKDEAC